MTFPEIPEIPWLFQDRGNPENAPSNCIVAGGVRGSGMFILNIPHGGLTVVGRLAGLCCQAAKKTTTFKIQANTLLMATLIW